MVKDLLAARGINVQTVRLWAEKFGRTFANEIRRQSFGRLGDKWHLCEAVVSIRGKSIGYGVLWTKTVSSWRFSFKTAEMQRQPSA